MAQNNGDGKGKGGGGGGEDPPTTFVPEIAYRYSDRDYTGIQIANRAGDQACLAVRADAGTPTVRGFAFDAANRRLAYSLAETGIYLAHWTDSPCNIISTMLIHPLSTGDHPEVMDFSPDGDFLVWTQPDPNYTGLGSAYKIVTYELNAGLVTELALDEWSVGGIRFSPDFADTNELLFVGGPLDLSQGAYGSLFAYDIDETSSPRKILDGQNYSFDLFIAVTNPAGVGDAKVTFTDNDSRQMFQLPLNGGAITSFAGGEGIYSCDNTEMIYHLQRRRNSNETHIGPADGSSSERYSRDTLRWLDWLCP